MPAPRLLSGIDPLVRLLLLAIALATFLPVTGAGRPIAQGVSNAAIFLLFLLNGLRLPRHEVWQGIGHWRLLVPLALWCFVGMGIAGWGFSHVGRAWLPPQVAIGFLFIGILPSTVQSAAAYTSLGGGNVAASVVAAAVINVLGVLLSAPLFALAAGRAAPAFDWSALERLALILLLPFVLGQVAQVRFGHLVREHRMLATWMDRMSIAVAVYVAFSGAVEQGLWHLMLWHDWLGLTALVLAFLAFGFGGSWLLSGVLGLEWRDRVTFLFAGGQKSITVGAPLATVLFPPAVAGLLLLPILTYHLLQLVLSAPLASRLSRAAPPPPSPASSAA